MLVNERQRIALEIAIERFEQRGISDDPILAAHLRQLLETNEQQAARENIHVMAERAAKALEREHCKQFEWSDEQFEIWWNKDDRCHRADRIAEAHFILLAAKGEGHE